MVWGMMILLLCQLAGTVLQQGTGLPIPGPVLGLMILLAALAWRGGAPVRLRDTCQGMLKYFGLLFVPAGVGVVGEMQALRANALAIIIAIPISTILGLAVTGLLMQFLARGRGDA
jgi:holin-like protein